MICTFCNNNTVPRTFTIIVKTSIPNLYELKRIRCEVCTDCNNIYLVDKLEDEKIVAVCREMDRIMSYREEY